MSTLYVAGHNFEDGTCAKCSRKLLDLLPYGDPGMAKEGDEGIACVGILNEGELRSLREARAKQKEIFEREMSGGTRGGA